MWLLTAYSTETVVRWVLLPRACRVGLLLLFPVSVQSCSGHASWAGEYTLSGSLTSVLPVVIDRMPTQRLEVVSSTLKLSADGSYSGTTLIRRVWETAGVADSSRDMPRDYEGTYTVNGDSVILREPRGNSCPMVRQSDGLLRGCGMPAPGPGVASFTPLSYRKLADSATSRRSQ